MPMYESKICIELAFSSPLTSIPVLAFSIKVSLIKAEPPLLMISPFHRPAPCEPWVTGGVEEKKLASLAINVPSTSIQ